MDIEKIEYLVKFTSEYLEVSEDEVDEDFITEFLNKNRGCIDLRKNTIPSYRTEEMVYNEKLAEYNRSNPNNGDTGATGSAGRLCEYGTHDPDTGLDSGYPDDFAVTCGIGMTGGTGEGQCESCKHFSGTTNIHTGAFGYRCANPNQTDMQFKANVYYNYWCTLHEKGKHASR